MAFRGETVTTTTGPIASYNKRRRSLGIFNRGNVVIFVSQDQGNIATDGWPIEGGAGAVFLTEDGDLPELQMFAIADSGSQNIRIQEGFGEE